MLEFMIAGSAEPEGDDVRLRVAKPSAADVENLLRSPEDVGYGTHYLLRGSGFSLVAISTTGPVLKADEPGDFLLYSGGLLVNEHAVREEVICTFLEALS